AVVAVDHVVVRLQLAVQQLVVVVVAVRAAAEDLRCVAPGSARESLRVVRDGALDEVGHVEGEPDRERDHDRAAHDLHRAAMPAEGGDAATSCRPASANTSSGIAQPTAKASVRMIVSGPRSPVAPATVMAASTGPAHGTNTAPRASPSSNPPRSGST